MQRVPQTSQFWENKLSEFAQICIRFAVGQLVANAISGNGNELALEETEQKNSSLNCNKPEQFSWELHKHNDKFQIWPSLKWLSDLIYKR